jgi:hypothetical protein
MPPVLRQKYAAAVQGGIKCTFTVNTWRATYRTRSITAAADGLPWICGRQGCHLRRWRKKEDVKGRKPEKRRKIKETKKRRQNDKNI